MSQRAFLVCTAIVQVALLAADLVHARRAPARPGERPLRASSLAFLAVVSAAYAGLQFAGLALVPEVGHLVRWVRATISGLGVADRETAAVPMLAQAAGGIALFYVAGFWDYLTHRFLSHSRALFVTHEYHHLPTRLNLALPGLGTRPFAVVATMPAMLGTAVTAAVVLEVAGLGAVDVMPTIYAVVFAHTVVLGITHSEVFVAARWMHRGLRHLGITSPQEHELHHAVELRGNFANVTSIWDRVLGTYLDPDRPEHRGRRLGLAYDRDYLGVLSGGLVALPSAIRTRFQVDRFCNIDGSTVAPKPDRQLDAAATAAESRMPACSSRPRPRSSASRPVSWPSTTSPSGWPAPSPRRRRSSRSSTASTA